MANAMDKTDLEDLTAVKNSLTCFGCKRFPKPKTTVYYCKKCQKVVCSLCHRSDTYCSKCRTILFAAEPILQKLLSSFAIRGLIHTLDGCQEELNVKKFKEHEAYCIYQTVPCPVVVCKNKTINFLEVIDHIKQIHPTIKTFENEWNFEGTQDELTQTVCYLNR